MNVSKRLVFWGFLGAVGLVGASTGACGDDDDSNGPGVAVDAGKLDTSLPDTGAVSDSAASDARTSDVTLMDATADAPNETGPASDGGADGASDAASLDGASDAKLADSASDAGTAGCADGTRDGLSEVTYPRVAACAGTWSGHVSTASPLCAAGSHVCTGAESALKAVQYTDAIAVTGCFAMNAAQDSFVCHVDCAAAVPSIDTAANVDMGAIGSTCPYKFPGAANGSCISGGRIDFSENSGTGCNFAAGLSGVLCCAN
ncbi:MAG: hypothetical protein IPG50_35420 [Myxococcales bacterium]|nr:hypothetical protein [Myxococcales bacterium]